jgi:hypothetical protein
MDAWQSFDFYLPTGMSRTEVAIELRQRILTAAADRGDFVRGFRIDHHERFAHGWNRWSVGYLPGPPAIGRFQHQLTLMRAGNP